MCISVELTDVYFNFFFVIPRRALFGFFFFLNNPPPPDLSPLPLHAPLPIARPEPGGKHAKGGEKPEKKKQDETGERTRGLEEALSTPPADPREREVPPAGEQLPPFLN